MTPPTDADREHDELDRFFRLGLDPLCIRDLDGHLRRVNPALTQLLGWSEDELLARPVRAFMHPDDVAATEETLAALPEDGARVTWEDRWRTLDGGVVTLAWSAVRGDDGSSIYAIARDVTSERAKARELRRAKELAEEANTAKSEFLANMSHEIRTPMNGIIGMTELTLDTTLTDQQREYLEMVRGSAGALLDVINSILDFSKIEAGKLELEQIDFTLWETITGALKPLALSARNKGIELLYDEGPDVPERLRGDPGRLRQALVNLVGNAVKFTEEGSVRLNVRRAPDADGSPRIVFEVSDTGIGIPPEKLDHIFGSFNQVDGSMSRRFGGTGLGLAITSGIVDMMGGTIAVDSEVGRGSTFTFVARFAEPLRPRRAAAAPEGTLAGRRVLAVDDHEANRLLLAGFTERMGMIGHVASSGAEALEALDEAHRSGRPMDLALLDCHMPEMGGFELAARIREDPRNADLIMVAFTAAGRPGDGARCEELGIASYLLKPLAPAELRDALLLTLQQGRDGLPGTELVTRHSLREARVRLHLLLAEDNRVNQQLAVRLLERFGHTVDVVRTGREVLDAMERTRFDAILMDVQMPEMDGIEATRRIRALEVEDDERIPIVAMTAHAMVGDRERFLAAGMDHYISKPISRDRLREVLRGLERRAGGPRRGEPRRSRSTAATAQPSPTQPSPTSSTPTSSAPATPDEGGSRSPGAGTDETRAGTDETPAGPEGSPTADALFAAPAFAAQADGDRELMRTLVEVFEADAPELRVALARALETDDPDGVARAAHALKGALGVFVADPVRRLAEQMEHLGSAGDLSACRGLAPALSDALDGLMLQLREHVGLT